MIAGENRRMSFNFQKGKKKPFRCRYVGSLSRSGAVCFTDGLIIQSIFCVCQRWPCQGQFSGFDHEKD